MFRQLIRVTAISLLFTGAAYAQIAGDTPNGGVGAWVAGSRGLGIISRPHTWEGYGSERNYQETVKRIPDKKPSNDPWKTVRQAPTASSPDRHSPQ